VKNGHTKIVRQFWVVRLENHRLLRDASACAAPSNRWDIGNTNDEGRCQH
jgi:hypothetical protein